MPDHGHSKAAYWRWANDIKNMACPHIIGYLHTASVTQKYGYSVA